jgi:hypothetical protein
LALPFDRSLFRSTVLGRETRRGVFRYDDTGDRNMKRWSGTVAVAVAVVAFTMAVTPAVAGAQETAECTPINGSQVCFEDTSISKTDLQKGEDSTLSYTMKNVGNETAKVRVVLNTVGPDNTSESFILSRATLEPGESKSSSVTITGDTPGTHGIQLKLVKGNSSVFYDESKPMTMEVQPARIGGNLDAPDFALLALVGALSVMGFIVYRRR